MGIVGGPGFNCAFFEWLRYVLAYLDILISALAWRWWGGLIKSALWMNATVEWLAHRQPSPRFNHAGLNDCDCDTACNHGPLSFSFLSLSILFPISPLPPFFVLSLAMPLFISQLLRFLLWYQAHGIAHATAFIPAYGVFIFNRAFCQYDFLCGLHMIFVVFSLAFVCWTGERRRRTTSNSYAYMDWREEHKSVCVCVCKRVVESGWLSRLFYI